MISGPSGVGKDSVLRGLREQGLPFRFVPTMNTRPKRPDEVDGVDYFFVTTEEFVTLLEQGELLEHAIVYGDYKGIPKKPIREALNSGQDVVLRVDVQGAATLKRLIPQAIFIFLTTPTEEELVAAPARIARPNRRKACASALPPRARKCSAFLNLITS